VYFFSSPILPKETAFFPRFIEDFSVKIGTVSFVFGNGETLKAPIAYTLDQQFL